MTTSLSRTTSLLAMSAFSSVAALALCSPAIAEPSALHHATPFVVAQGAPAPQLTDEEKKRIEDLKQRRLQRQGTPPQAPPAAAPPATPPAAAVKPPPPPAAPPAVVPRMVNPATPPPAPPAPAAKTIVPVPPATTTAPPAARDAGEGRGHGRRDYPPAAGAPPAHSPATAAPVAPVAPSHTAPAVAAPVTPPQPPAATPVPPPPPRAAGDAVRDGRRSNQRPNAAAPAVGAAAGAAVALPPPGPAPRNLDDAKSGRTESTVKTDGGNRTVIQETDHRTIVRQGNRVVIQKDEAAQLHRVAPGAVISRDTAGTNTAVVQRPNNVQIITETDKSGQLVRRFRRDREGRETAIIDNRRRKNNLGRDLAIGVGVGAGIIAGAAILNSVVDVRPPVVRVPRDKYVVRYEDASEDDVYEALSAPPVDDIDRPYTLDEVRATPRLRERMRRVDLDDINFEFGSWEVNSGEYRKLERIARAMMRVIERNPNEVFLIEGYTDAVGSDVDNLTLSDRRAETVSVILSEQFQVPFENLTTQGYGEAYLKVDTDGPEVANRRVAVRRITPLLARTAEVAPPPPPRRRYYDDRRRYDDDDRPYRRWRRHNRYRDDY